MLIDMLTIWTGTGLAIGIVLAFALSLIKKGKSPVPQLYEWPPDADPWP